jgi:hypothetical protein
MKVAIKNGQSRETCNLGYTRHKTKVAIKNEQSRETCNLGYTRHKTKVAIKNGQSREACNLGYTRHKTKTNKAKNTTQKTKMIRNTDPNNNRG